MTTNCLDIIIVVNDENAEVERVAIYAHTVLRSIVADSCRAEDSLG